MWIVLAVLIASAGGAAYLRWDSPLNRAWVERALADRYQTQVHIGSFHSSLFPWAHIEGADLVLERAPGERPLATIAHFQASASWFRMLFGARRLGRVALQGVVINAEHRVARPGPASPARSHRRMKVMLVLESVTVDHAELNLYGSHGGAPKQYSIAQVVLHALPTGQGMRYQAVLAIPTPAGIIRSQGRFGPWNVDDPVATPLEGNYIFSDVAMTTIGLAGTLSSTGRFSGSLAALEVQGRTATPDFALDPSDTGVPLATVFQARYDALNNSLALEQVTARLGQSDVTAHGIWRRATHGGGHVLQLETQVGTVGRPAQIADFLQLAMPGGPPLQGQMVMQANLRLDPGHAKTWQRLQLAGQFRLLQARFLDPQTQYRIASLSERGQGHPKQAADPPPVTFDMSGQFQIARGVANIENLAFAIPGAGVQLDGSYELGTEQLNFRGRVMTEAKISQMTTGIKSLLLHAVNPFFRGKGYGAVLRVAITGTRQHPAFHVHLR